MKKSNHLLTWLEKYLIFLAPYLVFISVLVIFQFGFRKMYFHQDDFSYLISSQVRNIGDLLKEPVGEHLHYVFRLFFNLEWEFFGLNFVPYFLVSIGLHLLNLLVMWLIILRLTHNKFLAWAATIIFSINTNWNETVLWISGQTITLSSLLVFWAYCFVTDIKDSQFKLKDWLSLTVFLILPGITSGLGVWLPLVVLGFYGINYPKRKINWKGYASLIALSVFLFLYITRSDGVISEVSETILMVKTLFLGFIFTILAIGNTAVGETLVPWDGQMGLRIIVVFSLLLVSFKRRKEILRIFLFDKSVWFAMVCLLLYYYFVGISRVQYGIGIAKANRYAYMGLIFILILLTQVLNKMKINRGLIALFSIVILLIQIHGFYWRAEPYTQRPTQVRIMVKKLKQASGCYQDDYLPSYVSPIKIHKYSELLPLINNPKITLGNSDECSTFRGI